LDESLGYYRADAEAFIAAVKAREIPAAVCATLPENIDAATRDWLVGQGIAPMQGLPETLNALQAAVAWWQARERIMLAPPTALLPASPIGALTALPEAEGKDRLRAMGLPVPVGSQVAGKDVAAAAAGIGFPVALKMMGARLTHKTEAGAVAINLGTRSALDQALEHMCACVAAYDPLAVTDSFLVEAMVPKPLGELIVTFFRDDQFGAAMTIGAGGVLVELLSDTATLLLPTSADDIGRKLEGLKIATLLKGYRGSAPADMGALIRSICGLADEFVARPEIAALEINPLFVCQTGIFGVDVLLHEVAPA
jgi:acyl-CoA synthetase (NDP forming)